MDIIITQETQLVKLTKEKVAILNILDLLLQHGWGKVEIEVKDHKIVCLAKRETYAVD